MPFIVAWNCIAVFGPRNRSIVLVIASNSRAGSLPDPRGPRDGLGSRRGRARGPGLRRGAAAERGAGAGAGQARAGARAGATGTRAANFWEHFGDILANLRRIWLVFESVGTYK